MFSRIPLYGRIILTGEVLTLTGLRVGGSQGAFAIGGVDLPVVRNPIDQKPYIPGSSLKGKMRSLWEKTTAREMNRSIGQDVSIHACEKKSDYDKCPVCRIYGTLGQSEAASPTRIIVRDMPLDIASLNDAKTDLPFTEVKWEAAIDRVTSAATPRQIERVPAGAIFKGMQIIFNIYSAEDHKLFLDVLAALRLVEDDYIGGHGSRGSGRVEFQNLRVTCKPIEAYTGQQQAPSRKIKLDEPLTDLLDWLKKEIPEPTLAGGA